jgi:hypothetical protein
MRNKVPVPYTREWRITYREMSDKQASRANDVCRRALWVDLLRKTPEIGGSVIPVESGEGAR